MNLNISLQRESCLCENERKEVMVFTMNGTDGMGTLACLEDTRDINTCETLRIDFVPYTEREIQELKIILDEIGIDSM